MKNLFKNIALIALFPILITSCSKKNETPSNQDLSTKQTDKVREYIKNLGFTDAQIVEKGAQYIVDGDIVFDKNMQIPDDNGKLKTEQYYNGFLVTNSSNIRVKVDASITSMAAEINGAIQQWNTVPNSKIKFVIVTDNNYDILIKVDNTIGERRIGILQGLAKFGGKDARFL